MEIKEILSLLRELDKLSNIAQARIGRWSVWLVIKTALCPTLINANLSAGKLTTGLHRIKNIMNILKVVPVGIWQYVRNSGLRRKPHFLVIAHSNSCRSKTADGRYLDLYLDELLVSGKLAHPPFVIENPAGWTHLSPTLGPRHLYEEPLMVLTRVLASVLVKSRMVVNAQQQIMKILKDTPIPLSNKNLAKMILEVLAKFEAERRIYSHFMRGTKTKGIIAVDIFGMYGKIAAAKELGIPVFDFQHGLMGPLHRYYNIQGCLKAAKAYMPVPDKILVYGDFWKSIQCRDGFWEPKDLVSVGSANMDKLLNQGKQIKPKKTDKILLLFTTQWTVRADAISFWTRFMKQNVSFDFELIIKIHPNEKQYISQYKILEDEFPKRCKVIFDEEDTYSLLQNADFNLSYYSTVLLEGIPLGIPSISICSKINPGGFVGTASLPELGDVIKHIHSVDELIKVINKFLNDRSYSNRWKATLKERGKVLFKPGFVENAARAINETIESYTQIDTV